MSVVSSAEKQILIIASVEKWKIREKPFPAVLNVKLRLTLCVLKKTQDLRDESENDPMCQVERFSSSDESLTNISLPSELVTETL